MTKPIVLNFSHPLTGEQLRQLQFQIGGPVQERHLPVHVEPATSMEQASMALLDAVGLSPDEWQTTPLMIVPPGLSSLAVTLIADLHGRSGHFPGIVVVRPVPDAPVPTFVIAELINLQAVRERRRAGRLKTASTLQVD